MLPTNRKINSFVKSIVNLCLAVLLFSQNSLFSQVINNTGAIISVSSAVVNSKDFENTSGTLGNNGTINLSGNYSNGGTTNGNGYYNIVGNWTDLGSFSAGTSTVTLNGIANQIITHGGSGETFYILAINSPGWIITQVANAGSTLHILNNLNLTAGTLSLHPTTANLIVGGRATIDGALTYNNITPQTTSIADILSGSGVIDMSGGSLPHVLNLAGATNNISTFTTSPAGSSTVNYNGTTQTVFAAPNYRNLTISNSGIKTLQGNSTVGVNLNISGGTFDLGTTTTTLGVFGDATITITGSLSFNGTSTKTVSLTGNLSGTGSINMSGGNLSHLFNLNGATNSIGTYSSGTGSTVRYILDGPQTVFTSDDYRNLTISGTGVKTLNADIKAKGVLTMSAGDINSNGNTLKVSNSAIAAIVRTSGKVIGKLQRAIGITGSEYLYPLGSATVYNPLKMTFQNLTTGPLTAQFKAEDIGIAGLPLYDDYDGIDYGNEIYDRYTTGYWSLTSVAPMASGSFSVNLNYTGFLGVDLSSSIIKRTNGGNLKLDGVHGTVAGSEITRTILVNGISTTTTDFAIGKGRPRINIQPLNIDRCEGSNAFFEVTARGRGTLTYQWQVNIGSGFTNIFNGGVYSGATTNKLILTGAPYSMNGYLYQCIITDAQGHTNTTYTVLLTVNKIPIATALPTSQNECPGIAFANIVLGTSNNVTGTTFAWSRTDPAGITTSLPLSGPAIGDVITGTFSNTIDAPITVTFTIIPTGPATTFCVGNAIYVTVTVNPTPRVFAIPATSIQCDSITTNIQLTSPSTFTSGLISFRYTVTTTGSVTGYTTPVVGLSNNYFITDKLINQTDVYQIVTYRVVPISPVGCADGPAQNAVVTVNPTPRVIPVNLQPAICYGGTTQIVLTSPTVMTSGAMRFDYTVGVTGGPGVVVGSTAPEVNRIPGYTIGFSYQNNSDTIQSVYYSIKPKVDNAICVPGKIVISEVKIHAHPLQSIVVTKPLTCSGGAGLAALRAVISKGANPYQVVWDGPVGYHMVDLLDIEDLSSGKYVAKVTDNLGCFRKDSISIVPVYANPYITPSIIPPGNYNISCIGSTDGTILVSVTGGITPPYNYWVVKNDVETLYSGIFTNNWNLSDPTTYHVYNNLGAGSYTLLVRDVNDCERSTRIVLRVPPPVEVVFDKSTYSGGYNVTCTGYNDGSASVQTITGGRGGYTYRWYTLDGNIPGSINTDRIDNITAGTYYLEIKDVLNCITIESVVITEPGGMQLSGYQLSESADGNFNISCNDGSDGYVNLTIAGGSGTYLYNWTGPNGFAATTKDISSLKAGSYNCTVTDLNGCILTPSSSFTLTEPTALAITSTTSTSSDGAYNINCNGGTGQINITVSGGSTGTYQYNWSTTDGSGIINGQKDQNALTAGTYHLVVTDLNNCVTAKDITLTKPPSLATNLFAKHITCESPGFNNGSINLTVTGGVAPYNYLWSNGASTEDITGLTEGYYKVNVTDVNGCLIIDSIRVNLPPPLNYTRTMSDYNGYNISCNGLANGSIQVIPTSGLAPFVYNWTGPGGFTANTQDIPDLKAGQYVLSIIDDNYCSTIETINLTEPGRLGMVITLSASTAGGFNINCAGDNTGFIGIEPLNQVKTVDYLWSDGLFGKTRMNLPAGDYSVILIDANNCHASSTITLTEPDSIKLVFDISQPFCPDKPDGEIRLNATGGVSGTDYSYKWSDNSTSRNISNILPGFYKVSVKDLNGCSVKDSVNVEPLNETCLIIPNVISPNGDLINDFWNIDMIELYPNMEIKIFNRWGEALWRSEKGYPKPWDGTSNGSPLPIDSYHYIIDLHNGTKPTVGNVTIVK
ncbi:MAG: gliding motility-associated C-terminal domain-containing protein [Bacteroidia bacterium]|nr:gliding motility-associated C-terminal domain-containing protein [Bacteroidia bacterium]